jgi:hypothetical protein
MSKESALHGLARYPLLDALRDRRSRRFGVGMAMDAGAGAATCAMIRAINGP